MGTTAKQSVGDFPKAPAGPHVARCYQVIDLGHQKIVWNNQEKWQPKIMLTWELLGEDRMPDGKPFAVSSRYTLSLSEKGQLRPLLESWRGVPFKDQEAQEFDVRKVLGAYCMLNVVHNQSNGKTYANVASVMPLPKAMAKPAPVNKDLYFNLDDGDVSALPEWIKNIVNKSKERCSPVADMEDDIPWVDSPEPEVQF
jgi:hypothetical protein